jgi:hypothetical protein
VLRPIVTLTAGLLLAVPLSAQSLLPINTTATGRLGNNGQAARYQFTATSAGVLTVAVHGEADLTLAIMDEDGQPVPDGTADRDLGGSVGAEMLAVVVPEAGVYRIEVRGYGDEASGFSIGASFVSVPAFARSPDPDGRPSRARLLAVGAAHSDELNPDAGDLWDWYIVPVTENAALVIVTQMNDGVEGDLALEAYLDNDFTTPAASSDQDLQGNLGNESVTVTVRAGQTLHVKVRSFHSGGGAVPYRVSVMRVP